MQDSIPEDQSRQLPENFIHPEKPPEKVQDAFKAFINSTHPKPVQVVPEKLFTSASLSDLSTRRSYFRTEGGDDAGYSFIESASTKFGPEGFRELRLIDDHSRVQLDHREATEEQLATVIDLDEDGRSLSINYDSNGDFGNLTFFTPTSSTAPGEIFTLPKKDLRKLRKFFEGKDGESIFRVDFIDGRIILTRSRNQDVLDMVGFPEKMDWGSVAERLFYPDTLTDPANADTALDESWKDPEKVKRALRLEWQKDLITPKSEPDF